MEKNRGAVVSRIENDYPSSMMMMMNDDRDNIRQRKKDEKLASDDPSMYCADRCVSTGHCDVYEDFFEMSPKDVVKFCVECVLSEQEEPCDVPDGFYDKLSP